MFDARYGVYATISALLVMSPGASMAVVMEAAFADGRVAALATVIGINLANSALALSSVQVLVDVDGTRQKAWLFLLRLMYAGRDFAWIYERQDQVSFLDGHVRVFAHLAHRLKGGGFGPGTTKLPSGRPGLTNDSGGSPCE